MSPLPAATIPGTPETALALLEQRIDGTVRVILTPNLRHSGLLWVLSPPQLCAFLCLLTFTGPRGEIQATRDALAEALHLHPDEMERHLHTLAQYTYGDAPLIFAVSLPEGETVYRPSKKAVVPITEDIAPVPSGGESYPIAGRDTVIELSREKYATPRAEVEALVAEQLGIHPPEPVPEGQAGEIYRSLLALGVPEGEARSLLAAYPLEAIERQLNWLPQRGARNPARFIVAAIRGNYDGPDAPRPGT